MDLKKIKTEIKKGDNFLFLDNNILDDKGFIKYIDGINLIVYKNNIMIKKFHFKGGTEKERQEIKNILLDALDAKLGISGYVLP